MPTRALGALLAAIAAAAFVVSILSGAWWDGHPRVDGKVFTAKDVHIGLLGGTGCNTGGSGECQPLPLGATFTTIAYGELGGLGLTTAFAILIAGAAWRVWDSRKRLAKLGLVFAALAAAGALGLLVLGPQIKTSQNVVPPIGWGFLLFGGGIASMFGACLATLKVEREPLRLKSAPKQPAAAPAAAGGPGGFDVHAYFPQGELRPAASAAGMYEQAPQLRPLYDVQGALPQPPPAVLPQRAPTPMPRASAHEIAGLDPPAPPPPLSTAQPFGAPRSGTLSSPPPPPTPPPFGAPRPASPSQAPFAAPPPPPTAQPLLGAQPPPGAPIASPGRPELPRPKPPTGAPPPPRSKPLSMPPAPFASPAIASSTLAPSRPSQPSLASPAIPAPPKLPSKAPSVAPPADPLAATMPAPGRVAPPPRAAKISVPPPRRDPNPPTPTPSIITSAPKPDGGPAPRSSQPTMTHTVPPMPQIDTPPPQLVRGTTQNDDSLETAMRETDFVTAVEIDHEAKARYEEAQRQASRAESETGVDDPPQPGDDTDATTAAPPITPPEEPVPFKSLSAAAAAAAKPADEPKPSAREQPSAPKVPISTAPASLPPPKSAQIPASGPTPACPQCEAPMAWVEEHLRFYCKSCRMYF